jgi:hypothetical protein
LSPTSHITTRAANASTTTSVSTVTDGYSQAGRVVRCGVMQRLPDITTRLRSCGSRSNSAPPFSGGRNH